MNCIIVDDNKLARKAIKQMLDQFDFLELKQECESAIEAFHYLQEKGNEIDLVFLDVEMPGMSGIELIKNLDKRPIIILVTAKKNYAVEAYEFNVADYIIKPVNLGRFTKAVRRAKELFEGLDKKEQETEKDYIFIRSNSILTKVNSNRIIYLQASGDHVHIHTTDKRHTVNNSTLERMEEKLPLNKFYKLHNSYLVAIDKIDAVDSNTAHVGKFNLPIAKQFKNELLKRLNLVQ